MPIDATEDLDETSNASYIFPDFEEESKTDDIEQLPLVESMAHQVLEDREGLYSDEDKLIAKTGLLASQYQNLADLCEEGKNRGDSDSIEALLNETRAQKEEATFLKNEAGSLKDYNLGQEIVHLFLNKEDSLDGILRDKGKKLTNLNQILKELNELKKNLSKKERLEKELKESSRSDRTKIQEQIDAVNVKIDECKQTLSGKKIQSLQSFFGVCQETTIEFPDSLDTKELKEIVSNFMSQAQSEVKQGFHSLQEIYLHKTGIFEVTKNILDNLQKVLREIVKNQKVNG